jgi:alpha-methylacyl-CoA racemase
MADSPGAASSRRSAFWRRYSNGSRRQGQHIDAAMTMAAPLMTMHYAVWNSKAMPSVGAACWRAVPYYWCYRTSDGRHASVGALEPLPLLRCGPIRDGHAGPDGHGSVATIERTEKAFAARPRDERAERSGRDVCVFPVLDPAEVWEHSIKARFAGARRGRFRILPSAERHCHASHG